MNDKEYLIMKIDEIESHLISIANDMPALLSDEYWEKYFSIMDQAIGNLIIAQAESANRIRGTLRWICFYLIVIIFIIIK